MITQEELAGWLTSRTARERAWVTSPRPYSSVLAGQLEITARIVARKRREAIARWFPATVAVCDAQPRLSLLLDQLTEEPLPFDGPERRVRCGLVLATSLRSAFADPGPRLRIGELLRLEIEIVRLTYHPPLGPVDPRLPSTSLGPTVAPGTTLRLAPGLRLLRLAADAPAMWERPAELAGMIASELPSPLDRGVVVALVRRPALQPVQLLRLGPGAADLLIRCGQREQPLGELVGAWPPGKRQAAASSVRQAVANGLLVAA